jgi:hypothetical protein
MDEDPLEVGMWSQKPTEGKVETPSPCKECQQAVPVVPMPWSEQERPTNQEGAWLGGNEVGHSAKSKAVLAFQVVCKPDGSQTTCQLSRLCPGSKRASQSHGFPQSRNLTDEDGHVDCKGERKVLGHEAHVI